MKHVFPESGKVLDQSWTKPLTGVARAIAGQWRYQFFDPHDFMIMSRIVRPPRPSLVLYKHSFTRRYLNLDDAGHAYRYLPPKSDSNRSGQYRSHHDLEAALAKLDLWELPWLKPGLERFRFGFSFEDRWEVRDLLDPIDDLDPPMSSIPEPPAGRGRGHLRLV